MPQGWTKPLIKRTYKDDTTVSEDEETKNYYQVVGSDYENDEQSLDQLNDSEFTITGQEDLKSGIESRDCKIVSPYNSIESSEQIDSFDK